MSPFFALVKADEERKLIYARATAEQIDKTKEVCDYASAVPEFQKWSKQYSDATLGKSHGNLRAQHNPRHAAGRIDEIIYNDGAKTIEVVAKVVDPVDWQKCVDGVYTGLSIGGGYLRKWDDPNHPGVIRYTPLIKEISLVDAPCLDSARILELSKSDGTTVEVLLKGVPRSFKDLLPPPTFGDLYKAILAPVALGAAGYHYGGKVGAKFGRGIAESAHDLIRPHRSSQNAGAVGEAVGRFVGRGAGTLTGGDAGLAITAVNAREERRLRRKMKRTGAQVGHWGKQELDGNLRKAAISSTLEAVLRGARRGNITRSLQQYHGAKMLHEMKPAIEAGAQRAVGAGYSTPGLGNAHTPGQKNFYGSLVRQQGRHRAYQLGRQHGLEVAHELGMAGKQEAIIATLQKGRDGMPGPFASQRPSTDPQKAVNFMYPTSKVLRRAPRKPVNLGAFGRAEPDGDMAKAGAFGPVLSTPEAKAKIKQVLHEAKSGKLRSWRGRNPKTGKPRRGPKVTDRRQAIAIALNSARRLGKVEEAGILEALLKRGKVEEAAGVATDVATSVLGAIHARRKTRKHADSITQVKVA